MLIANRPLPKSHPRNRPSGATPKTKSPRMPIPNWLWLVAGLGAGILVTSLINLRSSGSDTTATAPLETPKTAPADKPAKKPIEPAAAETPQPADKPTTKFDFYTLLPEQEVIEPNERPTPTPTAAAKPTEKGQKPQTPTTTNTPAPGEEFVLQAGSFKSGVEADRRRAQIQTLGLPSRLESVSAGGDTWYRVLVGPFPTRDAVGQARDKLAAQSIDTIVVRKKAAR